MAYAKGTKTSISTSEEQIKTMLRKAGAERIAMMEEPGGAIVAFHLGGRSPPDIRDDDLAWVYVYLMSCGRFTKVGIARNPAKRRDVLQRTNPYPVKLERKYVFQNRAYAYVAEQASHVALADYRMIGEWFDIEVEAARPTVREIVSATRSLRAIHRKAGVPMKAYGF